MINAPDREQFLDRMPTELAQAYRAAIRAFHDAPEACFVSLRALAEHYAAL